MYSTKFYYKILRIIQFVKSIVEDPSELNRINRNQVFYHINDNSNQFGLMIQPGLETV